MDYNIDDIKVYLNSFQLNEDGEFTDRDIEDYVWRMSEDNVPDFNYESGISKFVIIPDNLDYVIKIPFTGYYQTDFEDTEDYEQYFISFYGGGGEFYNDYIAKEIEIYNSCFETPFIDFLLPSEEIGKCCGIKVYIQKKANPYCYFNLGTPSLNSIETVETVKEEFVFNHLPNDWIAFCLEALNEDKDKLYELLLFLDNFEDLHTANIGYYNNHPIVIDYAGFHD